LAREASVDDRNCYGSRCQELNTTWRTRIEPVSLCKLSKQKRWLPLRRVALTATLFSICLSSSSQVQSAPPSPPDHNLPLLSTARAAHSLTDEQARRAYPVHLQGVITYFDPDFGTGQPAIFIHDATGGIFIKMICKLTCKAADPLFVGALVDVRGVSAPGGFGPVVGSPQIRILGRAPLPARPPRVNFAKLRTGDEDA